MNKETYTPGYSQTSRNFMAKRLADTHAYFVLPFLEAGMRILDCGCGPGTISRGFLEQYEGITVIGVDRSAEQIEEAAGMHQGVKGIQFQQASVYELPFADASFDLVFSHALFEHIAEPETALREMHRVLKPEGKVALCSPDFGAFVISPDKPAIRNAFEFYRKKQESNGGETLAGRRLHGWLGNAGFTPIDARGRCENYDDPVMIGEYLAEQLDEVAPDHAAAFRNWMKEPAALFAQMWISVVAVKTNC